MKQRDALGYSLDDRQKEGQGKYGKDSLDAELPSQNADGQEQQDEVDGEIDVLYRKPDGEINNGCNAGDASRGDVVGQQEYGPSDAVHNHAQGYHEVIFGFMDSRLFGWKFKFCVHFLLQFSIRS